MIAVTLKPSGMMFAQEAVRREASRSFEKQEEGRAHARCRTSSTCRQAGPWYPTAWRAKPAA